MNHRLSNCCHALALLAAGMAAAMTASLASEVPPVLTILPAGGSPSDQIGLGFDKPQGLQLFVEESKSLS